MLLGIVSDTHGHIPNTRSATRALAQLDVETVIHCGDIGSGEIVPLFSAWPTHFVLGNVDTHECQLQRVVLAQGQSWHHRFGSLELQGRKIALLHGDDLRRLRQTIDGGQWDLVCCGHTHVAKVERRGSTLVVNPGAVYRARQHSLAVVDLPSLEVTHVPLT